MVARHFHFGTNDAVKSGGVHSIRFTLCNFLCRPLATIKNDPPPRIIEDDLPLQSVPAQKRNCRSNRVVPSIALLRSGRLRSAARGRKRQFVDYGRHSATMNRTRNLDARLEAVVGARGCGKEVRRLKYHSRGACDAEIATTEIL